MEYLLPALTVATLTLIAAASPGPDFLCVLKNALSHGFRSGVMTAIGVALGIYVHVAYCLVGLAVIISNSILAFNVIKWIGAAYLVYLAIQSFRSKGWKEEVSATTEMLSSRKALVQGFVTNALNPKATLFFLALFTQVIDPHTPIVVQGLYGVASSMTAGIWFTIVSAVLTRPLIRAKFARISVWIDRACGAAFLALAAKLALTRNPAA